MDMAISAVPGIMFDAVPDFISPTVRVANISGFTSRGMIRLSALLSSLAIITGSIVFCGSEECPPLPSIAI